MIFAVRCLLLVRKHQPFLICYIIIGIVFVSNFFFLLKQLLISFAEQTNTIIAIESVCTSLVNLQVLTNILFVQRQWLSTRRQLYRMSITPASRELYRKQYQRHKCYFNLLHIFFVLFLGVGAVAYYFLNVDSEKDQQGIPDNVEIIIVFNRLLISYMVCTTLKNFAISTILFISLFRFYRGLRKINMSFNIDKCNLSLNILAFGLPIISGISYCIFLIVD